jgi:hypothetical protein
MCFNPVFFKSMQIYSRPNSANLHVNVRARSLSGQGFGGDGPVSHAIGATSSHRSFTIDMNRELFTGYRQLSA